MFERMINRMVDPLLLVGMIVMGMMGATGILFLGWILIKVLAGNMEMV